MFEKTEAVVLRVTPFSRTSQVVGWFAPRLGRMSTLLKGALRQKSPFLGQCDLFYTCEIVFYSRGHRHLHILKECCPLVLREEFRSSWKACACASYFTDLLWRICPPGAPPGTLYRLLSDSLDAAAAPTAAPALVFWFELQILRALGLAPQLAACASCGGRIDTEATLSFAAAAGGVLCRSCSRQSGRRGIGIPLDSAALLRVWQECPSPHAAPRLACSEGQRRVVESILGSFLEYHLETTPLSREITLRLLRGDPPPGGDDARAGRPGKERATR